MEATSLTPPSHDSSPPSGRLTPPARNSMEDEDASVKRKRPRLDSGQRAHHQLGADYTSPGEQSSDCTTAEGHISMSYDGNQSGSPLSSNTQPEPAPPEGDQQPVGTPSKVTLNLRDPNRSISPAKQTHEALGPSHDLCATSTSARDANLAQSAPSPATLTGDEAAQDPVEIEVAEPEDIDGPPDATVWHTASDFDWRQWHEDFLAKFPVAGDSRLPWPDAFNEFWHTIIAGPANMIKLLKDTNEWLASYLDESEGVPHRWAELTALDPMFWKQLNRLYRSICRDEFMSTLEQCFAHDSFDRSMFVDFLCRLISITKRLLRVDQMSLEAANAQKATEVLLHAPEYVHGSATIVCNKRVTAILKSFGFDDLLDGPIDRLHQEIHMEPSFLKISAGCVSVALAQNRPDSSSQDLLTYIFKTVQEFCTRWAEEDVGDDVPPGTSLASRYFDFYESATEKMQFAIKKQFPMVNLDILAAFVSATPMVVQRTTLADIRLIARLLDQENGEAATALSKYDRAMFANVAWKLRFLERSIREGRMEIRIHALETLSKMLIDVFRDYIQNANETDHVIVQWTSATLRESKIIDYLLSVDSHPQLVSRSDKVIGFLAASHTYSAGQTDMIWKCVQTSEDPRMFEQIVAALSTTFGLLDLEPLLYFCSKFSDLPACTFDHRYRNLLLLLLGQLQKHWQAQQVIDLRPYIVLLRLLRQIGNDPTLPNLRRVEIWKFAQDATKRLLVNKWDFEQRLEVYQHCLDDFNAEEGGANGTCLVLNRLFEFYGQSDLADLSQRTDFINIIVSEFNHLKDIQTVSQVNLEEFSEPVKERLRIIEKILLYLPETISPELGKSLWASMVGEKAIGRQARNDAWESLATVANHSSEPNAFLDLGIDDYLPTLDPSLHVRSLLAFAHHLWDYQSRVSLQSLSDAQESTVEARDSLFWQLALSTADDFLAAGAVKALVERVVYESKDLARDGLSKTQAGFVQRAVTQLIDAAIERKRLVEEATKNAQPTDQDIAAYPGVASSTIRFQRAFIMLKQLGQNLKALEPNPPSERSDSQTSRRSINGQRVEIKYQTSDRGIPSPIKLLEIGDQSTVSELIEIFKAKTGFSKFNLIAGGQRVNQDEDGPRTVASCGLNEKGALILHKIPGSESTKPTATSPRLKPLEQEIMKYFPRLYELLSIDSRLSQSVLDFLTTFPPHEDIIRLVTAPSHNSEDILPLAKPCKLLYSLHAMKFTLQRQLEEGLIRDGFMVHCVTTLVKTLLSIDLTSESATSSSNLVAFHLVVVLLMFLKEPVLISVSEKYFESPPAFVDKIVEVSRAAQAEQLYEVHQSSFAVLLEASRLSPGVWDYFTKHSATIGFFRLLLLCNPRVEGRLAAQRTILSILSTISTVENELHGGAEQKMEKDVLEKPSQVSSFLTFVWTTMASMFPDAAKYSSNSAQFFDLAVDIFKRLNNYSVEVAPLQAYLHNWLALLLQYRHNETIGQDNIDRFVKGVCELINQSLALLNKANHPPQVDDSVLSRLFSQFLFPPITASKERQSIEAFGPILSSETRLSLYMVTVWLSTNDKRLRSCVEFVYQALLEVSDPGSAWNYERQKNVRSTAGYPGLMNLSNTCYLNSLTTQLFMNPRFREFILGLDLIDPNSQKLLFALRQLFADVQDGWNKSINTQDLADAIETYEGPLDPAIQMDVDEAFNLIFDRIESQLLNRNDEQKFKNLFGGQIVQQIKSKECDHISERLEPVTAVQCDIQGKTSLEESLKAYIEGEIMEGDNKYKCSTCDRYVNAVKRACLRDVPDNLIFHLKRFDYDLLQGTRNKLNDYFSFPERVDMTPYTDKYLQDPSGPSKPDIFLLTGVLVHSGTAELGHYYSFIRERPVSLQSWVEFNDADVSRYDARNMQEHCFGGDYRDQYTGAAYPRMYNAYMLFYQRENSIEPEDKYFGGSNLPMCQPVRVNVPHELSLDLATRNEVLARTYCFFDPTHAKFLRDLNIRRNHLHGSHNCSDGHVLEETYLHCLWQHILYVFGRDISKQGCADVLGIIAEMMANCLQCCFISIDWLVGHDEIRLRLLLLRLPDPPIRQRIGSLLCDGMAKLRNQDPDAYGSVEVDLDMEIEEEEIASARRGMFNLVMNRLRTLQRLLPHHMRAWVDFYDLLTKFVAFGPSERIYMYQVGFLQHAIETLLIDNDHDWSSIFSEGQHQVYIKTLEKRQFNLSGLVRFIGALLPPIAATHSPESNGDISIGPEVGLLSETLIEYIKWPMEISDGGRRTPWFLDRFASSDDGTVSNYEPLEAVVRVMVRADAVIRMTQNFENLVQVGLEKNPAWLAEPYLHAALAFMDSSDDAMAIENILKNVVSSVPTIGNTGGAEHLEFFKRALHVRNMEAFPDRPDQVKLMTLQTSNQWAPTLLFYPKDNVADKTRKLIEEMFKQDLQSDEDEELDDIRQSAFDVLYARTVNELSRFLSSGQAVGEYCGEALRFCESFLQNSFLNDSEDERATKRTRVRELLSRVQNFLVLSDDGSNMNGDSDELTDVSSTYEDPNT